MNIKVLLTAAAIAMLSFSSIAQAEPVNVCTGKTGGNYVFVGETLSKQLRGQADLNIIETQGSWENLQKMSSGECDVAVVQSDSLYVWNETQTKLSYISVQPLYTEQAHLLCNRSSKVEQFSDLNKNTKIFVGSRGSGAEVTANGLKQADIKKGNGSYKDVPYLYEDKAAVALGKVKSGLAECLFYVGSKGNSTMQDAERLSKDLVLVPIEDKDFNDVTMQDSQGNSISVWNPTELDSATYKTIMPSGMFGNKDLPTVGVTAILIVSERLVETNPDTFSAITFESENTASVVRSSKNLVLETK